MSGLMSRMSTLSETDCAEIHEAATHILATAGIIVEHERLLQMAIDRGYNVDVGTMRVRWQRDEIDKALEESTGKRLGSKPEPMTSTGDRFVLRSAIRKYVWHAGSPKPRIPTLDDIRDIVVLSDALENVAVCCLTSVGSQDTPRVTAEIHAWAIGLTHLRPEKIIGYVLDVRSVPYLHELWTIARDGESSLYQRPMTYYGCFISTPLAVSRQALEILFPLYDLGVPVSISGTMPIVGASAPMSLCGTLALGMAEGLGGMMLTSLFGIKTQPGTGAVLIDQRSMSHCYNSVEGMVMAIAQQDLVRWYGFSEPTVSWVTNEADDANSHGFVAGMQRGMSLLFGVLGGIRCGYGGLASSDVSSLPLLVLDDEFASLINRLLSGMKVNKELLAIPLIERLALGGSFLTDDEALDFSVKHLREELFLPKLMDRRNVATWLDSPDDAFKRAEAKVKEILTAHDPHPLTEEQERAIQEVVAKADRDLAG